MTVGASASNFEEAMRTKSRLSTITRVERIEVRYGSRHPPRPTVEARVGRPSFECKQAVARFRRTFGAYHRHPQWPSRDYGGYGCTSGTLLRQSCPILAGSSESVRHRCRRTGKG